MPNSWQKSLALEVLKTKQNEFAIEEIPVLDGEGNIIRKQDLFTDITAERTGYSFLDKLQRGYISHHSKSFEYTDDTQYLLGMFLRALKYHKNLDYLSVFNCVVREEIEKPRKKSYIPIVIGETYSLFIQATSYVFIVIQNSLTGDILKTIPFEKKANNAFLIRTDDLPTNEKFNQNTEEYLQIVVDTEQDVPVTALIGVYSTIPCAPIYNGTLSAKVPNGESFGFSVANYPSLYQAYEIIFNSKKISYNTDSSQTKNSEGSSVEIEIKKNTHFAEKLKGCMLGTSISNQSNKAIRRSVQLLFNGENVEEIIKRNTPGLFDINGNSDRRFPTQGV